MTVSDFSPFLAQVTEEWNKSPYVYQPDATNPGPATFKALEIIFANVLTVIFALAAFASFAMLIAGGFRFLTSGGDPKATAQAKGTITWAIAGLLLLIGAWFILRLIQEFTGVEVTKFQIPSV